MPGSESRPRPVLSRLLDICMSRLSQFSTSVLFLERVESLFVADDMATGPLDTPDTDASRNDATRTRSYMICCGRFAGDSSSWNYTNSR